TSQTRTSVFQKAIARIIPSLTGVSVPMRSYFVDKFGSFDGIVMRDVEEPQPGPREVLIRIAASSLNFRDIAIIRGQYGGPSPKPGFVPLSDGAGEIAAVGPLVRGFAV